MPGNAFYEHEMKQENYDAIRIEKHPNGVVVATLNKPEKLNAVDPNMHLEILALARDLDEDPDAKVMVLTGAGRAFCAGGDFSPSQSRFSGDRIWRQARQFLDDYLDCEKPIISAINGPAMGLGFMIALLADVVYAARSATMGDTHTLIGMGCGDGSQVIWPMVMGPYKAKYYLMTGETFSAETAEELGLVNFVVEDDELMDKAMALANRLAEGPGMAISASKMALNKQIKAVANQVLPYSLMLQKFCLYNSEDAAEAMDAFRNKRPPEWKGR
ncbi:enoyl-CoA hydratase-related protein [Pseudohaliea sp.]|uniref:enoyl-CoA hydratase-related protein n=1 Tax=Pseudohaliea sp. TaxID=2740289 RepID=UPI0032EC22DB